MNSETKVIGLIGLVTIIIIVGGLWLAGKNAGTSATDPNLTLNAETLVRADSPRKTGANAKVQIVEFGDLECPACAMLNPELKKLLASDGDKIDLIIRFIPIHGNSKKAAAAAMAAGEQGKFFEMYDLMFEKQGEWTAYGAKIDELFEKYASQAGVDIAKYKADLAANQSKYYALVDRDAADADATGVNSTPTLVINGNTVVRGVTSYEKLKELVAQAEAAASTTGSNTTASTTPATN